MERQEYELRCLRERVKKKVSMHVWWVGKQESSHQHLWQSLLESDELRTGGKSNQETEGAFPPCSQLAGSLAQVLNPCALVVSAVN